MLRAKKLINEKYQYVGFLPNSVRIKENGFWGINDYDGTEILPSSFIEVFTLSSGYGLIAARDSGSWNIYDYFGNKINNERYDYVYPYYGMFGTSKVKIGNKWGLLNKFGELVIPVAYQNIEKFGKGIILQSFNSKVEYIDKKEIRNFTKFLEKGNTKIAKSSVKNNSHSLYLKKTKSH